jgi:hypothetical protein
MRGKNAKIIHRYARVTGAKTDTAAKALFMSTPGPQRAKLKETMREAINPTKRDKD